MSPVRNRDRRGLAGRSHLVLVRGGLDGAEPEDRDWQSFCERIGWKPPESAPPDDYEDRLLERIERLAGGERILDGGDDRRPVVTAPPTERFRARRALATAANVAVVAALCAAASAVLWWAARPAVSALPRPDVVAPYRATTAKVVDRDAPAEPSERPRDAAPRARSPRSEDGPTRPAPSETKPSTPRPDGPGALVAQRSLRDEDGARQPADPLDRDAQPPQDPSRATSGNRSRATSGNRSRATSGNRSRAAAESVDPIAVAARSPGAGEAPGSVQPVSPGIRIEITPREAFDLPRALSPVARAWPEPVAPDAWTRQASSGQVVQASASWSLSPEGSRWYGVALPPSGASLGLPPGVGVMAQLDLGKAIDRF